MRFLAIAWAAALLSLPAVTSGKACEAAATTTTLSAEETKPAKKPAAKKMAAKKTEKVEYMRAVPVEAPKK